MVQMKRLSKCYFLQLNSLLGANAFNIYLHGTVIMKDCFWTFFLHLAEAEEELVCQGGANRTHGVFGDPIGQVEGLELAHGVQAGVPVPPKCLF